MAAPEHAHIKVTCDGPERWQVELNGQRIEQFVARDGLSIGIGEDGEAIVSLTFADVKLDADLQGLVDASRQRSRRRGFFGWRRNITEPVA